ncbi:MAG: N-6 DNA methylase [Hyphomicrobium sp.]
MADAALLLQKRYTLQATNVPFLGRSKQSAPLVEHLSTNYYPARHDLAIAMLSRMLKMATPAGAIAAVTPQNWLFLGGYKEFRRSLVTSSSLRAICLLGEGGFMSSAAAGAFTALAILAEDRPIENGVFACIDADSSSTPEDKRKALTAEKPAILMQKAQLSNPDTRIGLSSGSAGGPTLQLAADSYQGVVTGDLERFVRCFWEVRADPKWRAFRTAIEQPLRYGGVKHVILWEGGTGRLHEYAAATRDKLHDMHESGNKAWSKSGIAINRMRDMTATFYYGEIFDNNVAVIIPRPKGCIEEIAAFCLDARFPSLVRALDRTLKVTNATILKAPFDRSQWARIGAETFPLGVPHPYTKDPTERCFHGHPLDALPGLTLHIALARLCGFRWSPELDPNEPLSAEARDWLRRTREFALDTPDCLYPLPAIGGQSKLADQLRNLLRNVYGHQLVDGAERALVTESDRALDNRESRDASLDAWISERAFRQHCVLYHQRPFLWHIWDGLKDGFSVFVDYHRFDQAALRKLTYTVLGDWLARAKAEKNDLRYDKGRELQQKLEKILEGESPYDIFVRWKPLAEQPLGWDPDLDDGVRLNIRPFVEAGVLRDTPKIKWTKDRGSDVPSAPWYDLGPKYGGKPGDRVNDHHTTLAEKRAAREAAKKAAGGKS